MAGVGPGHGAAIARRFDAEGYAVVLLARSTQFTENLAQNLNSAKAYACDVTSETAVASTFDRIRADPGEVETLLYNAGSIVLGDVEAITATDFESAWRVNALVPSVVEFWCDREGLSWPFPVLLSSEVSV